MTRTDYLPVALFAVSLAWILIQSVIAYFDLHTSEKMVKICNSIYCATLVILNTLILLSFDVRGGEAYTIQFPDWFSVSSYEITFHFYIDLNGVLFAILSSVLFGIISSFSYSYLHKDRGFYRYFILMSILCFGVQFICYAGSLDLILIGWELVGLASVMLIAFFNENVRSVRNSFRALVFYRFGDIALLLACIFLHYYDHGTDISIIKSHAAEDLSHWVGLFIVIATLPKSAQFPFCNWLYRAMEGPTTSSAVFYGALSVHLGPFLLLRTQSLWMNYPPLRILIFVVGAVSALYAFVVGRTRSDIKSGLAFSTILQIGIIYMELAMKWNGLALAHMISNALLRCWQFLRSSSIIHDFSESALTRDEFHIIMSHPRRKLATYQRKFYIHALNGFYLDYLQDLLFVKPVTAVVGFLKRHEGFIFLLCVLFIASTFLPVFAMKENPSIVGTLVFATLFALLALHSTPTLSLIYILISEILFIYCGIMVKGLGMISANMLLPTIILIAPILIFLTMRLETVLAKGKQFYQGLFDDYPRTRVCILILGWFLVGVPGGPVQLSNDVLFYRFIDISPWILVLVLVCSFANVLAFYSLFSKMFYGRTSPYKLAARGALGVKEISISQYALIGVVILVLLCFGMFPRFFVGGMNFRPM